MALNKKSFIKNGIVVFFSLAAGVALFCNNDYNPFADPDNANVYVTSWTFTGKDSIALFETGTFTMVVAARYVVDSFVVLAPKNRYWTDTIVKRASPGGCIDGGPYSFEVSFFDTGRQTTTLTVFRSNGRIVEQDFPVRVYNPLRQEDVSGFFGDTLLFLTTTVPDEKKGVLYYWSLGGNWNGTSVSNRLSAFVPLFSPPRGEGLLWVTDLSGNNRSPSALFSYAFNDTSKPVIRCINDGAEGDTIFSGDTVFAFRAFISDAASAAVESCSVNRSKFDFVNRSANIYTKLFKNLPELTPNSTPFPVTVFALDNFQFRNASYDTFFVVFREDAIKSARVSVAFERPAAEMVTTSQRSYLIHGTVQSSGGDTMTLSCRINEDADPLEETVVGAGEWSWLVSLDTTFTTVTVSAHGTDGSLLASAQRVIVFDPNAVDSVQPMIWEVSTDDQLLGNQFYTEKSALLLKIVAFDDGSGMAHLSVNQDALPVDSTSYVWWWNTGTLVHGPQGNPVRIVAIDRRNNRQERTVVIYKNMRPSLIGDIDIPGECCAESTYSASLFWNDADNDPVALDSIKVPDGMTISREGDIVWKPVLRTGDDQKDTLVIELSDPYEKSRYQWIFSCRRCSRSPVSMVFTTSEKDFPDMLQAGVDRLSLRLSIDSLDVAFRPKYSAVFIDNGNFLLDNDTSCTLFWAPSLADTGYRKLMITVGDGVHSFDTLFPALWVVPKNQYPCSLSVAYSGETTPTGVLDLFSHPAPETLFFSIRDQDHPLTESYTVTVTLGSLRSVEILNQKDFFIVIEPDTARLVEILAVTVGDRTGARDSVYYIIQYGSLTANTPPLVTGDPGFPLYCCADSAYEFQIGVFDPDGDSVIVVTLHAPAGMTVSSGGRVQWVPPLNALGDDSLVVRLFDHYDSSTVYRWAVTALDCNNMPPAVRFRTSTGDFPTLLQAGIDSISLQLETVEGTGVRPFVFKAQTDNGFTLLNDTTGKLFWIPTGSDTGVHTMAISVKDRYSTMDSLSPQFTVVPRNCRPCSLSYTYSGPTLPSGQLSLFSTTQPESALFTISDEDHPVTERYVVTIMRGYSMPTTLYLAGEERSFSVTVGAPFPSMALVDTTVVSVSDSTGTSDTVLLIVRYPIVTVDDIPDLLLSLRALAGVTTTMMGNSVSRWADEWNNSLSFSQMDYDRQPTVSQNVANGQPAILFDEMTDNGDDGLFNTAFQQWSDTPFTVFIVFSARLLPVNERRTLISSNTTDGFGLGITCNGTIGIFNNTRNNECLPQEWAGTDLSVTARTWYLVTYQSGLGITVGGNIRVQAWLNGTAASEPMELMTQSNAGTAIGTGSMNYDGSFDGWIASVKIYQRDLSDDERTLVERYLGSVYGIPLE
ncbi:MAG: hypothetical protein JXA18_00590 [Chitinispirillaceae bacterium]|nr:hypothetical protein [Chitinispirillaceae bacterium]